MNRLMTIIFTSAFVCLASYSPIWAEGWGNTNWGMNIPQVEMTTKGKVILNEKNTPPGISHKLQDNISIGEHNFAVFLNFASSKLDKVMLKVESAEHYAAYLYLVDELKKKYGSPSVEPKEGRTGISIKNETEWVTQDTVIKVSYIIISISGTTYKGTTIIYSPRQSASSGNL